MLFKKYLLVFLSLILCFTIVSAADKDAKQKTNLHKSYIADPPVVEINHKFHKKGTLWSRVGNYGETGDDAYTGRTHSADWPGGSGNSYLYRGSIWLSGRLDDGVIHSSQPEGNEWGPIDSVHYIENGLRAEVETFTKYYDVKPPTAEPGHVPLGLEVTERTYSWSESFRDDFIIYELTIKNVGLDSDDDGYPDTPSDITEFYFTYRLDGDVSKLPDWPVESKFCNIDDNAAVNSNWGILDVYPAWDSIAGDFFTDDKADSTMMFMWDDDNPSYPAWDGGPDDDAFNPGINGGWQTPGFLGVKILKTEPESFRPSAFHVNNIYNDPETDQEAYDRMMAPKEFGGGANNVGGHPDYSGMMVYPGTLTPYLNDYRAVLSLGPIDTLFYGDSVIVTFALGVGADTTFAHVKSLVKLIENMDVAQRIIDEDWNLTAATIPAPILEIKEYVENGITKGLVIEWDRSSEDSTSFLGYRIQKSAGHNADNQFNWQPLGLGTYVDSVGSASWPPPYNEDSTKYKIIDTDIVMGFDYYYSVQSLSVDPIFGVIESNLLSNTKAVIPGTPPAANLDNVKVVPNPYVGSARWNNPRPGDNSPWQHRLQFINIPGDATVKIFTLDLDFVAEIKAGRSARVSTDFPAAPNYGVAEWDLITRNNQEAAPGIYIFVVKSPTAGEKVGKFVIVR
jgi:hypothetical protein